LVQAASSLDYLPHLLLLDLLAAPEAVAGLDDSKLIDVIEFVAKLARSESPEEQRQSLRGFILHMTALCPRVRSVAVESLYQLGSAEALCALLGHPDHQVRQRALRALPRGDSAAVYHLTKYLARTTSEAWQVRESAVRGLAIAAPRGHDVALTCLAEALEDPVREVRIAAVKAFRAVSCKGDVNSMALLAARLQHEDWRVRCCALEALAIVSPKSAALATACQHLRDSVTDTLAKHTVIKIMQAMAIDDTESEDSEDSEGSTQPPSASPERSSCRWADFSDAE